MGKIVKYCNACEESFAEKFSFCPNCGAQLEAFEMKPLSEETNGNSPSPEPTSKEIASAFSVTKESPATGFEPIHEARRFSTKFDNQELSSPENSSAEPETEKVFEFDDEVFEEPLKDYNEISSTATFAAAGASGGNLYQATYPQANVTRNADNDFHITIIEEKNVKQRNLLLLAFFVIFFSAFAGGIVYSIFNTILDVAEIETDKLGVFVGEVEPVPVEEEFLEKDKDKGGGGGGGGREEKTPASKGREAAQVPNPLIAPDTSITKISNPTIAIQAATTNKNERKAEVSDLPYGLKTGSDLLSNGMGSGGGQGEGRGRGQGTGIGDGLGSGKGSGRGGGLGNGEGNDRGDGSRDMFNNVSVVKKPVGPTVGVQILSKPRANYTNEARQQQIQGTVILRVTFLANGTIGGITTVKGLGGGLTEQAIIAARNIKFEPAKRGGVPYSVTKTIEYNFNIY